MSESENAGLVIVSSVAREKKVKLPPLIQDARENPLLSIKTAEGSVYIKPAAMPYTKRHMLIVPDLATKEDTPSVTSTPDALLGKTFHAACDIAGYYTKSHNIQEIDIGFNYSPYEDKKHIATQQRTLHVHVVGFDSEELDYRITRSEALKRPDLKTKVSEPLSNLASELIYQQVLPIIQGKFSNFFRENFEISEDKRHFTLQMKNGLNTLNHPDFPAFLKLLHAESQNVYNEIAKCFLTSDIQTDNFLEGDDGRYELLSQQERNKRIAEYLARNPNLSESSKRILLLLSGSAKTTQEVIQRKEEQLGRALSEAERKQELNRFMAIKNFAYATVISGKKTGEDMRWSFGMDPAIFSTRDILQASRSQIKLFERNPGESYDQSTLERVASMESDLTDYLLKENPEYRTQITKHD